MTTIPSPLDALLTTLGVSEASTGGKVRILGSEQNDISYYRVGTASALAHAAFGVGIAANWRSNTGEGQDVVVEIPRATQALFPHAHTRQNGRRSPFGSRTTAESKAFWRTRDDRSVLLVTGSARPHQLQRTLEALGITSIDDADEAIAEIDAFELEEAIYSKGAVAAVARTPDEWNAHPQGRHLATRPVVEIDKINDSEPERRPGRQRPLQDIRVLDATHVIAGPTIGRMLAEHGANVLHVSPPTSWDPQTFTIDLGVGKRHAIADLDDPGDAQRFREVAEQADVFIQSFRPESFDQRGFSPAELAARRPGIVVVSVSCFGGTGGPWSTRRGVDPIAQAVTGIAYAEGGDGPAPRMSRVITLNDPLAGVLGAAGVAAALARRSTEGGSYHVRVSLARVGMWLQSLGPADCKPNDRLDTQFSHLATPRISTMKTPFGVIDRLAPATQLSRTPGYWTIPPHPHGASRLDWTD